MKYNKLNENNKNEEIPPKHPFNVHIPNPFAQWHQLQSIRHDEPVMHSLSGDNSTSKKNKRLRKLNMFWFNLKIKSNV